MFTPFYKNTIVLIHIWVILYNVKGISSDSLRVNQTRK